MSEPREIAQRLAARLESAWNAGDGVAFAAPFTDDADFVDIRGEHHQGRPAIARGHAEIFTSIYRDSRLRYAVQQVKRIAEGALLVHSRAVLAVPAGPLAGTHRAIQTLVVVDRESEWRIASFHNTPVTARREGG